MKKRLGQTHGPKRRKYRAKAPEEWLPLGVLVHEIDELLAAEKLSRDDVEVDISKVLNDIEYKQVAHGTIDHVTIVQQTSNGDGLAILPATEQVAKPRVVVVPFTYPGDEVTIRVFKSHPTHVEADLLAITKPLDLRDDSLIHCKYFGRCLGCQFQNTNYDNQLEIKRQTIVNAYKFFAKDTAIPEVSPTQLLPQQYHYRTKLTPHFNMPMANYKQNKPLDHCPPLGFGAKGRPEWRQTPGGSELILDIEECSIGTPIVNVGMKNERLRLTKTFQNYRRGATVLLREDTTPLDLPIPEGLTDAEGQVSTLEENGLRKLCATNTRQIVHEVVNGYTFEFSAGEFFQNNNLILPAVTSYVKGHLALEGVADPVLVDAYCGLGLFSITCSEGVSQVIGVEVSADLVAFARRNAANNNVANARFVVGKAEQIFDGLDCDATKTLVILDPPRKGCDEVFLSQLAAFNPAKIVYISCNVHSQARDVAYFIGATKGQYVVEEIKGFDFFPNTHHVELVAVMKRVAAKENIPQV